MIESSRTSSVDFLVRFPIETLKHNTNYVQHEMVTSVCLWNVYECFQILDGNLTLLHIFKILGGSLTLSHCE